MDHLAVPDHPAATTSLKVCTVYDNKSFTPAIQLFTKGGEMRLVLHVCDRSGPEVWVKNAKYAIQILSRYFVSNTSAIVSPSFDSEDLPDSDNWKNVILLELWAAAYAEYVYDLCGAGILHEVAPICTCPNPADKVISVWGAPLPNAIVQKVLFLVCIADNQGISAFLAQMKQSENTSDEEICLLEATPHCVSWSMLCRVSWSILCKIGSVKLQQHVDLKHKKALLV